MMASLTKRRAVSKINWDADRVKSLRQFMGLTQQLFADKLGVRQQTVSEWEKSMYRPRGATVTLLNIVAEQAADPNRYSAWQRGSCTRANGQSLE
ncbi:MAG: helix-turn-helix domain-containing protein [Chloroflexi bacterium]|nr:helix-turn-helix domain-containing protein [Chloroflexota bacterium]